MTLRYKGKLHHIGVGCPYAGWRVILLVAGLDVQVLGIDGSPLRHLTLDPQGGLPADPVKPGQCRVYDVLTQLSPMSRDITESAPRDSNPKPAD